MKLTDRKIVAECGNFWYGVDEFDGSRLVPWCRLKPTALIGQEYCWTGDKWSLREKQHNAAIV